MKNTIILGFCTVTLLIGSCHHSNDKGAKTKENYTNEDSCVNYYAEDDRAYEVFKSIYANEYGKITSLKVPGVNIFFKPVKNAFDSTRIDSVINIKAENSSLKYYSRKDSKILLEAKLSDNRMPISKEIMIGMSYTDFGNNVLKKYLRKEIFVRGNCIDISTPSEFENLHFIFVADRLVSFSYTNNVQSFR